MLLLANLLSPAGSASRAASYVSTGTGVVTCASAAVLGLCSDRFDAADSRHIDACVKAFFAGGGARNSACGGVTSLTISFLWGHRRWFLKNLRQILI